MYEKFDSQDVPILTHAHDNNATVTKFVREERQPTENAKDTWHVTKKNRKRCEQNHYWIFGTGRQTVAFRSK